MVRSLSGPDRRTFSHLFWCIFFYSSIGRSILCVRYNLSNKPRIYGGAHLRPFQGPTRSVHSPLGHCADSNTSPSLFSVSLSNGPWIYFKFFLLPRSLVFVFGQIRAHTAVAVLSRLAEVPFSPPWNWPSEHSSSGLLCRTELVKKKKKVNTSGIFQIELLCRLPLGVS